MAKLAARGLGRKTNSSDRSSSSSSKTGFQQFQHQ
jgi:hypothetical protein